MIRHRDGMDDDRHRRERTHDTFAVTAHAVVVVGIDGSGPSWDAFYWACGETRRLGGSIVAVFVHQTSAAASAALTTSFAGPAAGYEATRAITDLIGKLDDQVRSHARTDGIDIEFVHTHGNAAKELLRIARSHRADLIVVGRSTKARHQLAGSLGRRLVGKRGAPVIVVVP